MNSNPGFAPLFVHDILPKPLGPGWDFSHESNKRRESAPVRESPKGKVDGKEEENSRVFHDENQKKVDDDDDDHPELIVDRSE